MTVFTPFRSVQDQLRDEIDDLKDQLLMERQNHSRTCERLNVVEAERCRWKDRAIYAEAMMNRLVPFFDEWKESQRPRNGVRYAEGE